MMNGPMSGTPNKGSHMAKSASQYKARTNFLLEHLASFTMKSSQEAQIPAKERLAETKEMLAKGTLWTKEMEMRLTDNDIVLLDGETQDVIEVYPLSSISVVQHINEDSDLNSVLLFTTQQTDEKYAATHLFQSDRVPAAVVATEIMKASSSKGAMPNRSQPSKGGSSLPPPPAYTAPQPPALDKERMDLYERSLVAQTIAAFSVVSDTNVKRPGKTTRISDSDTVEDSIPVEVLEARTNRDVQILNHCIDDIESLVQQTKRSAEAWKKLQKKKGKIKPDNPLAIEARPPPESDFIDAFQKFKHAFNLLGKLRPYLHHPNAAELVHYLFVPLSLVVRCTNGPEKARGVLSPLLSMQSIELLQNCLSSKEMELWSALGPNWTESKQSKPFKDMFIPPYAPVFKDGWVPHDFVGGKDVPANISAAVAANAAAVAQMNDQKKNEDPTSPTVLSAAAKFRRLTSVKKDVVSSPAPKKNLFRKGAVLYEFNARNSKELTVKQGEEISVLDDSRQWWCVRNANGEIGFIPHTIIEGKSQDNQHSYVSPLPSPPATAPPPIPTASLTNVRKVETTETSMLSQEERKVPFVELRHVSISKKTEEQIGPKPPPPPPMSPPPPTPPPVSTVSQSTSSTKKTVVGRSENEQVKVSALEKAVLSGGNLRKVDKEAEKRRRDENQVKRMSSADLLTDELKRRMTHGQGALTPRAVRKTEHEQVIRLSPDSGTNEVRDWLKSKNFSPACMQALAWKSAKDLDKMSKEDFKKKCGDAEGARAYSQFAVQKSTWKNSSKGNELQFIMQRRKEMVDVESNEPPSEDGNLRNIVAEARAVTDESVTETTVNRQSYTSTKPIMVTAPQERKRPQSMVIETNQTIQPPVRPRSTSQNRTPPPTRRKSRGLSSVNDSFIPPPPADYHDYNDKSVLTPEQVEAILVEQKKQQDLLMEHEKQFALLERLQIQKRELEEQKREYEELQKRQRQSELEEKQKELEKQIKTQQDELKANQSRIEQQNQFLSNVSGINMSGINMAGMMMSPRQFPVMGQQVMNPQVMSQHVMNPQVMNPQVMNPHVISPQVMNPQVMSPQVMNPQVMSPQVMSTQVMSPQVQMVPVSSLASQPTYISMPPVAAAVQPVVGYAPAMAQTSVPQMVPSYTIPQ